MSGALRQALACDIARSGIIVFERALARQPRRACMFQPRFQTAAPANAPVQHSRSCSRSVLLSLPARRMIIGTTGCDLKTEGSVLQRNHICLQGTQVQGVVLWTSGANGSAPGARSRLRHLEARCRRCDSTQSAFVCFVVS